MAKHSFKGVDIHYEVHGNGPCVVLIHGFLESVWMWKDLIPEFAKSHKVIAMDLPGHGMSENIGYVHQMDEMAECVQSIVHALGIRRVKLIGHSMGGYVALAFADLFPDQVRKLVLYQSTAKDDTPEKKADRTRAMKLIKTNHQSFIRSSIPMLFRPKNRAIFREQINELKSEALKTSRQGVIAALTGMRDRPNREIILKFAPYPVDIIASDYDPRIPLEESIYLSELSENVNLVLIKGAGHISYIEALDDTIQAFKQVMK